VLKWNIKKAGFDIWKEEALQKRDDCRAGNLSFDEFVKWIDETSWQSC